MRIKYCLVPVLFAAYAAACSSSSSTAPSGPNGEAGDTAAGGDPSEGGDTAAGGDVSEGGSGAVAGERGEAGAGPADSCGAATQGLSQLAAPGAPVLDPNSFLQRVDSNDAFCSGTVGSGQLSTFGPYGYQLTVRFTDAESDGPTSLDDAHVSGVVRLASDPDIQLAARTDQKRWGTANGTPSSIIMQLCLPKVYAASELTVGFDIADNAGHRSKAICIRQQSGG